MNSQTVLHLVSRSAMIQAARREVMIDEKAREYIEQAIVRKAERIIAVKSLEYKLRVLK